MATLTLKNKAPKAVSASKAEKKKASPAPKAVAPTKKASPQQSTGTILYPSDLVIYSAVRKGLPKDVVTKALASIVEAMAETLANGGEIRLPGLGRFFIKHIPPRRAFDIKSKMMADLPAMRRAAFKVSKNIKSRLKK